MLYRSEGSAKCCGAIGGGFELSTARVESASGCRVESTVVRALGECGLAAARGVQNERGRGWLGLPRHKGRETHEVSARLILRMSAQDSRYRECTSDLPSFGRRGFRQGSGFGGTKADSTGYRWYCLHRSRCLLSPEGCHRFYSRPAAGTTAISPSTSITRK